MKKRILSAIACSLVAVLGLLGSSCSSDAILNFNNSVHAGNNPSVTYSEQAVYKIYSTETGKSDNVDNKLSANFSGEYKISFWVYESLPANYLPLVAENELLAKNDFDFLYLMTTELNVEATYSYEGKSDEKKTDYIKTLTIFTSSNNAYAPIYSETTANYSLLGLNNEEMLFQPVEYKSETIYGQEEYVVKHISNLGAENQNEQSKSYEYTFKSLIDNTQLFFAIRNTTLEDEKSTYIPVVAPQYGEKNTLKITRENTTTHTINGLKVQGEEINGEDVKLAKISYVNSTTNKTGMSQEIFIQAEKSSNGKIENRAILFKYNSTIYEHGSNAILGTLVYELTEISYK